MRAFREAVEAGDLDAVEALPAENVVFTSPVVFRPYPGKAITAAILRDVIRIFEETVMVRPLSAAQALAAAMGARFGQIAQEARAAGSA